MNDTNLADQLPAPSTIEQGVNTTITPEQVVSDAVPKAEALVAEAAKPLDEVKTAVDQQAVDAPFAGVDSPETAVAPVTAASEAEPKPHSEDPTQDWKPRSEFDSTDVSNEVKKDLPTVTSTPEWPAPEASTTLPTVGETATPTQVDTSTSPTNTTVPPTAEVL